ncbi:MAG: hypothetical protein J6N49_01185, partial [Alphaproteobacteria bacterium]|nr:hypothetical protein [Alphaproteobacteria bacterium]
IPITPTQSELNDYQRGVNRFKQANAAGSFMSGMVSGFDNSRSSGYGNIPSTQKNYATANGSYSTSLPQSGVWAQQRQRAIENDLLMNGMDVLYGMNRTINGMTFGGLDWLGNKLGIDTQMNEYLNLKDSQSRNLARRAGQIAGYGGSALTGGALGKSGLNSFIEWNGRRNLINQLSNGNNFKDIRYRNISDDYRNILNDKRQDVNQPLMQNNRMYIPANVVRKLYNKRIINDGMTPEDVANSIDNAIYRPNSAVFQTKYNQNQALVNSAGNKLDMGFVSVNPSKPNQNVIKSDYQIKIDDLYRTLFGAK